MNIFKKGLGLAVLLVGAVACSNDDVVEGVPSSSGDTYASIQIKLPGSVQSNTRTTNHEANHKGNWSGRDKINTVDVFLVHSASVDHTHFSSSDLKINASKSKSVITPKQVLKATPGESVKAYVLVNANKVDVTKLNATKEAGQFSAEFKKVVNQVASEVARYDNGNDVVLMTNTLEPVGISIKPKVTKEQAQNAKEGSDNYISLSVQRVVGRAMVTQSKDLVHDIAITDFAGKEVSKIRVNKLTYGVGLSNNSFLRIQDIKNTPNYGFTPTANYASEVKTLFDFSMLVPKAVTTLASTVEEALKAEPLSTFVLPVVHTDGNYKKGNTTFFEIRAEFEPVLESEGLLADGVKYEKGMPLYLGMTDGKFYSARQAASEAIQGAKQEVTTYSDNTMIYVLWLNPDHIPGAGAEKATISPTLRNNVYHVNIKSFKKIGLPSNPLDPTNPDTDPENPTNPIDPTDPLQKEDTYLSVEVSVLDWELNSYDVDLDNNY